MPLTSLAGNHALKEQLLPRLSGGGLGHAFILAGPAGSGKHTLAGILAQAMVCSGSGTKPCGGCSGCKKALSGIHPDIITIAPGADKAAITVDQVRLMRADAYIRPNEASRKVYILEAADQMLGAAQNAMLKLLEEGPTYAAFFLLCENPSGLLTTVRSRCEMLRLTIPQGQEPSASDEKTVQMVHLLVQLWLDGKEAALMEQCVRLEKDWERQQFAVLIGQMADRFCALLPTASDRRRVLRGVQLMDELSRAVARNVGTGALAGWLCAACCGDQ